MVRFTSFLSSITFLCVWLTGCGGSSGGSGTGPTPVRSAKTVYVDLAGSGSSDGSSAHPYKTVTAALAAGVAGDTIRIAGGTYEAGETFPLNLKPGNLVIGAGRNLTYIKGDIRDVNVGANDPVTLQHLRFDSFMFGRDSARGTVTGTNTIHDCLVTGDVQISHGGKHNFTIDTSQVNGLLSFSHGPGASHNRVQCVLVWGGLHFGTASGVTDSVIGNSIMGDGLLYQSASTDAYIIGNLIHGQLIDKSGAGVQMIAYDTIGFQINGPVDDTAAVILKGMSVTFMHNIVDANYASGLIAYSGTPTIIDSNQVNSTHGAYGIFTSSGGGEIVGNLIVGGGCGLYDMSGAARIAYDTVYYADTGLYCAGPAHITYNIIANCTGDGVILDQATGAFDNNYVGGNVNGVRILAGHPDLGGGAHSGVGINYLQANTHYDLVNESADTIYAKYNYWDHSNVVDIEAFDIYDYMENAAAGPVIFQPFN
jgi:hypothetical protein